ncbi:ABC transporter ATP-binding protein/permease [Oscillochloris sp. ZM17-4]|uniref:ABC transporter ATP-binding protein n=1 Tax=Oscillochloris sp. ZM17-4 TaxID=2866714 RepID=UPI001C73C707|nr:ABC transporter ATP-binding protein [Oscillochloris sp. ZM17-4]MBX0329054.1 ABC transporter ATP-binding protein/permease [Oscillochloris sp. ZM17-4]
MHRTGLRFLLPYMRPYRWALARGTLYALIGASASAFSPALLGRAIDELGAGVRPDILLRYAAGLIGLAAILSVFRYLLRMLTGEIAAGVTYRMSQDLFQTLLTFDQGTMRQYGIGDLLSRATSDFIYIWRFYSAGFQMSMHALLLLMIGCALMAVTSPGLAAVVVVMLVISVGAQVGLGRIVEGAFDKVQQEMAHIAQFSQEHLSAARMITAYGQEHAAVGAFRATNDRYAERSIAFALRSAAISTLPGLLVRVAAAIVLGVGGALIISGQITLGEYVQFIVYLGLLNGAAQNLSGAFERLQQGSAAAGRIGEVLRRRPAVADAADAIDITARGHLRFEGVSVQAEGRWALREVDIDIPAGSTLGVVGATGAGKSTLLGLVARVRDPDAGRVTLDGHDLRAIKLDSLRAAMAYVPQETLLFGMSLRENIALGAPDITDEEVRAAVRAARLSNDLPQLPQGMATVVGERGATLSGGQKQRTAIARALARSPHILLLDDSLSSVDAHTAAEILAELTADPAPRTRLVVSQRLASVRDAEQIIVLDEGRVIERGTHRELLAVGGRYAAMYRREIQQAEEIIDE